MEYQNMKVEFLEAAHTASILILLNDHGKIMKTVAWSQVSNGRQGLTDRFNYLEKLGLIEVDKTLRSGSGHWVSLTDKGKEIAEHLIAIEQILES